jgi:hypothetical protein
VGHPQCSLSHRGHHLCSLNIIFRTAHTENRVKQAPFLTCCFFIFPQAYYDKVKFATDDAMRVGRLHTHLPGWQEANVAWMRSGGYSISKKISKVGLLPESLYNPIPVQTIMVWVAGD